MRIALILVYGCIWAAPLPTAHRPLPTGLQTVMVPMRDGVKLATDIYLPAEGKFPVLLERTPYNKAGRRKLGEFLAQHGYVALIQDSRGRYGSEGRFVPFDEGQDGYDAIEWAATQPWSNGQVGTFGGSYTGMDQYQAAMYRPPHLVGMFIQMAGASLYDSVAYPGGTPNSAWFGWLLRSAATSPQAAGKKAAAEAIDKAVKNLGEWMKRPQQARSELLRDFPDYLEAYRETCAHPAFDDYWKQPRFATAGHYGDVKDVPIMFVTGWYDNFMQGTLDVFSALSKIQKTEKKLMVGPWPHGIGTQECGGAAFGPGTTEDQAALVADWFGHLLRRLPFELVSDQKVQIYRMGGGDGSRTSRGKLNHGGEWRTVSDWPPRGTRPARYYIHGDGMLQPDPPSTEPPSRYEFDPRNPVPTLGGRYSVAGVPACIQDQTRLKGRPDILSFSSAPLAAPVEVTGRIRALLWVASDAPETDFTAKLMDVYPDGYALNLADGELRAHYRSGAARELNIDLGSTSNLFGAGHRIRLDISSSSFPKFEPNPNAAHNTVYHEVKRASYVELPFLSVK